jgi:hypothetical protein
MATCTSYNCDALGSYNSTLDNCSVFRTGGTSALVFLDCDHQITDPTSGVQILAEIAAGRGWLVENLKVGFQAGSPVTVDPVVSCGTSRVVKNTYTMSIFDAKVDATNNDFWNQLANGYVIGGLIANICPTDGLADIAIYVDSEISFQGGLVSEDVNTGLIRFEMTATWQSVGYDVITAPTGVWD